MARIVTTSSRKKNSTNKLLPVIALAIVAVGVLYIFLKGSEETVTEEKPESVKPQKTLNAVQSAKSETGDKPAELPSENKEQTVVGETQNVEPVSGEEPAAVKTNAIPPEIAERMKLPRTALKLAGEQYLAMLVGAGDDSPMPPMPPTDERTLQRDLMIALTNDIVIYDDEDEASQRLKENVAAAKLQLKEFLEKGGTITEAVAEFREWRAQNVQMRREVRQEYVRLRKEASMEEANQYLEEANKALAAEGVDPVVVGPPRRKKSVRYYGDKPPALPSNN